MSLRDKEPSVELREGIVKRAMVHDLDGVRGRGRLRISWNEVVGKKDVRECGLNKVDVQDQV